MSTQQAESYFRILANAFRRLLELALALFPLSCIFYVYYFSPSDARFEDHGFHEFAIAIATLMGGFISYVSWRCYVHTGEIFVKWLTIGLTGFTVIYSLHGLLTPTAHHNVWLFILYGPASRLFLAICLIIAVSRFRSEVDAPEARTSVAYWGGWLALFLMINLLVAGLAHSSYAAAPELRYGLEGMAIVLNAITFLLMLLKGYRSPLMSFFGQSLFWFSFSSLSFILSSVWNHQWWLAHLIFATGFCVLSYGVLRAYMTTNSFNRVFAAQELFEDLYHSNQRLEIDLRRSESQGQHLSEEIRVLQVSLGECEALFAAFPDAIIRVDEQGVVTQANNKAEEMFRYPEGGMVGIVVEDLIPKPRRQEHIRNRRLREYSGMARPLGLVNRPLECLRKDGTTFSANIAISNLFVAGKQSHVTFVRDITSLLQQQEAREQADREALVQQRILKQIVSQVQMVAFQFKRAVDGKYSFPFLSEEFETMFGIPPERLKADAAEWLKTIRPSELDQLVTSIEMSAATRAAWSTSSSYLSDSGVVPFVIFAAEPELNEDGSIAWAGHFRKLVPGAEGQVSYAHV